MNKSLVANQTAVLLSMLTDTACKEIVLSVLDMIDDAAEMTELSADHSLIDPIKLSIRRACASNEKDERIEA